MTAPVAVKRQCEATSKQSGERCKNAPKEGRNVCRMHGGTQPVGIASRNWRHGRKSKYVPNRFVDDIAAAQDDPDLASFRDEIIIVDARISDLLKRVDSGESGETWKALQESRRNYLKASEAHDKAYYLQEILDTILEGSDYQAWEEVHKTVERRQKLVEAELKILVSKRQMMPADRVLTLFAAVMNVVRDHVKDPEILKAISRETSRLVRMPDGTT